MSLFSRRKVVAFIAIGLFLSIMIAALPSLANIMLAPKRVVFEGRTRSATVVVLNTSRQTKSYNLGWKMVKADENGKPVPATLDESAQSVSKMVVFSPRRVTIEPNGRQTVRLSLRRPADLPMGEYRGHLVFSATEASHERQDFGKVGKGIALALNIGIGMSIPIIVRQGEVGLDNVQIADAQLAADDKGGQFLNVTLTRKVNEGASAYGNMRAYTKGDGKNQTIATSPNLSFYPDQPKRVIKMALTSPVPAGTKIYISYDGSEEYNGQVFAEKEIMVTK